MLSDAAERINNLADYLVTGYRDKFTIHLASNESSKNSIEEQTVKELIESLKVEKLALQSNFRKYKINIHGNIDFKIQSSTQFELKRVVSNLINNAIEAFTDPSGVIDLILSENKDTYAIEIKDNGVGIPSKLIEKIFERGTSFNKKHGTGIGLAHAKETIEKLGGKININSKEGIGTLVQIVIPKL